MSLRAKLIAVVSIASCVVFLPDASGQSLPFRPVLLARGAFLQHDWAVGVVRHGGRGGKWRPCILERVLDVESRGGEDDFSFESVAKVCARLPAGGPPNIVSLTAGDRRRELTVFGMAFAPSVRSVSLDFGADGVRQLPLKKVNKEQAQIAQVRPLRFAAFPIEGDPCLVQVKGYGATGGEIYRGPIDSCPPGT